MDISLQNIRKLQKEESIVHRVRLTGSNKIQEYKLLSPLSIILSNNIKIFIPVGFVWDLSSVPRFLWGILPPDGDFELAALIHDFLYKNKITTRSFADKEMLIWSKVISGTNNKISIRNLDNWIRYIGVKLFGWWVWYKVLTK